MNWTAVSAIASLTQSVIVIVTVLVAVVQLRDSRRAMRFDTTRALIDRSFDPVFYRALQFVVIELEGRLRDASYANELTASSGWAIDAEHHLELGVLARIEEMGLFLKHAL